jgi:hypothetical protein
MMDFETGAAWGPRNDFFKPSIQSFLEHIMQLEWEYQRVGVSGVGLVLPTAERRRSVIDWKSRHGFVREIGNILQMLNLCDPFSDACEI